MPKGICLFLGVPSGTRQQQQQQHELTALKISDTSKYSIFLTPTKLKSAYVFSFSVSLSVRLSVHILFLLSILRIIRNEYMLFRFTKECFILKMANNLHTKTHTKISIIAVNKRKFLKVNFNMFNIC